MENLGINGAERTYVFISRERGDFQPVSSSVPTSRQDAPRCSSLRVSLLGLPLRPRPALRVRRGRHPVRGAHIRLRQGRRQLRGVRLQMQVGSSQSGMAFLHAFFRRQCYHFPHNFYIFVVLLVKFEYLVYISFI